MKYWILTKFNFISIGEQEQRYKDFIELLQDFYCYHFDCWHSEIPKEGIAYTATSLDSLKSEMGNLSRSSYIELIEKKYRDKFNISVNSGLSFKLVSSEELINIFPDVDFG